MVGGQSVIDLWSVLLGVHGCLLYSDFVGEVPGPQVPALFVNCPSSIVNYSIVH